MVEAKVMLRRLGSYDLNSLLRLVCCIELIPGEHSDVVQQQ